MLLNEYSLLGLGKFKVYSYYIYDKHMVRKGIQHNCQPLQCPLHEVNVNDLSINKEILRIVIVILDTSNNQGGNNSIKIT